MEIKINTADVLREFTGVADQVPYAAMLALNKTANDARAEVRMEMERVFDRPTPWVLNTLRITYAKKTDLVAKIALRDTASDTTSPSMLEHQVAGGPRRYKAMEGWLMGAGVLPPGWDVVPGSGAQIDGYGNMNRGQIKQIFTVIQSVAADGAASKIATRLKKGTKKQYGFAYFINPVGSNTKRHLPPGIYQRVSTGFGTVIKPVMLFVKRAAYRQRLDFFGIIEKVVQRDLANNLRESMLSAIASRR